VGDAGGGAAGVDVVDWLVVQIRLCQPPSLKEGQQTISALVNPPMRISFTADEGGSEVDEYAIICGVADAERFLTFQRDSEDGPDDWGIYLEYTGQVNAGYGCVSACHIDRDRLSVDLGKQLGQLAGIIGFDIALRLDQDEWTAVRDGLRLVFRNYMHLLSEA
jgi:hypothetical protein